jgi:hypothetical protein
MKRYLSSIEGVVFHGSLTIDLLLRKWFPLLKDFEELPIKEPNVVEAIGGGGDSFDSQKDGRMASTFAHVLPPTTYRM